MDIFNRIMVVLGLVGAVFLLVTFMMVPVGLVDGLATSFSVVAQFLEENGITFLAFTWTWIVFTLMGMLLLVILLLLLYLEIRRPARGAVRILHVSGGEAEVSTDSIAQRLEHNIDQLAEVISVRPMVTARRGGVEAALDVETSPDIDVPSKTEEICQVAREVLEERMGLKLNKITVNIRHAPYPEPAKAPDESP